MSEPNTPQSGPDATRFEHPSTWPTPAAAPPPAPRRGRGPLIAAVVTLGVLLAGAVVALVLVSADRKPATQTATETTTAAAAPATSAVPAATTGQAAPADPAGVQACAEIAKVSPDDMYDPDILQPIGAVAVQSTDFDIRVLGQLLVNRAKLARAAKGQDDELTTKLEMSTTGINLSTRCIKAGYTKP